MTAAEHFRRGGEPPKDPENYSYLVEEDVLVRRSDADLLTEPGRSSRWWPSIAGEVASV
jgi:hypothetical protein